MNRMFKWIPVLIWGYEVLKYELTEIDERKDKAQNLKYSGPRCDVYVSDTFRDSVRWNISKWTMTTFYNVKFTIPLIKEEVNLPQLTIPVPKYDVHLRHLDPYFKARIEHLETCKSWEPHSKCSVIVSGWNGLVQNCNKEFITQHELGHVFYHHCFFKTLYLYVGLPITLIKCHPLTVIGGYLLSQGANYWMELAADRYMIEHCNWAELSNGVYHFEQNAKYSKRPSNFIQAWKKELLDPHPRVETRIQMLRGGTFK